MEFLKLRQCAVGVAVGKGPHGLGVAVVFLHRQGLGGGHPFQPVVDAVGGPGQSVVAGVLPVTAADGAARTPGQVVAVPGLLDGDGAAVSEGCGVGRECQQAEQSCYDKQHGHQTAESLMLHKNNMLLSSSGHKEKAGR